MARNFQVNQILCLYAISKFSHHNKQMNPVMDTCILSAIFCQDKNDFERDERSKYLI